MTLEGYFTASRYKAIDSQIPTWLALYDVESPELANSAGYQALMDGASAREKQILATVQFLQRRIYKHVKTYIHPNATDASFPGKYLLAVSLEVSADAENDFNKWYDEEHMGLLAKIPGWLRGRRYEIHSFAEKGSDVDAGVKRPVLKYLAIHDFDTPGFKDTEEFKVATSTPWRDRVMKTVTGRELRIFERNNVFSRPE